MFRSIITALAAALLAAPSWAESRLFVVSKQDRVLEVYDPSTGKPLFKVAAKGALHEVVVSSDGRLAYVADYEGLDNVVSVIDVGKKAVVHTINMAPAYRPHGLALSRDDSRLYVTCEASQVVVEVDTQANKVARRFPVPDHQIHTLTLSPDGRYLYTSSTVGANVLMINLEKGAYEKSVLSGTGCESVAVSPDGSELWAVNRLSQTLGVIDVAKGRRVQAIACGGKPLRICMTPDGGTVAVTCTVAGELALFDRARRTERVRIAVGGNPTCVAFGKDGAHAYVTNGADNDVAVVDMKSHEVVRRFAVGPEPEGVALSE
jgi:YVTN family beta-propeller protein